MATSDTDIHPIPKMVPITRDLVHFCATLERKPRSDELLDRTKQLLLDYLGVALAGSRAESAQSVYRMLARLTSTGPSTVLGTAMQASPEYAALANGTAAHGIELDDTHQAGSIHLGVVMFSTAIALDQTQPDSKLEQFLSAVVAGYEVAARLAMAVQPKHHYEMGFHPTATCGVFGAAVTAAKMLGLTEEQMLSAVGIAGSMAAGSLEFLAEGTWTKRLHPGLAAHNGILAARLAAAGFLGPSTILEGRDGFLFSYSKRPEPRLVLLGLGEDFAILHTSVKPHACCRYMQSPIDGIVAMATEHDILPEQVDRIEVAVLEAGWPLVCEPTKRKYAPSNIIDAQFSMPFGAAVALRYRKAGLDQFTEDNLQLPEIHALMEKVILTRDQRIERNFPEQWAARIELHLKDGRHFDKFVRHPKGDPENPLNWTELTAKFESLANRALPHSQCERIVSAVKEIAPSSTLRNIWELAAAPPAVAGRSGR